MSSWNPTPKEEYDLAVSLLQVAEGYASSEELEYYRLLVKQRKELLEKSENEAT